MTRNDFFKLIRKPKNIPMWAKVHYLSGFAIGVAFGWILAEMVRFVLSI